MSYFIFKNGHYNANNPSSLDYRLMGFINRKPNIIIKTDSLKSAIHVLINRYMNQHGNDGNKYRILYKAIENYFDITKSESDPNVKRFVPLSAPKQLALNLETIIRNTLKNHKY